MSRLSIEGQDCATALQSGALKRQITSGNWNVADVLHVDDRGRVLYFVGVGREAGRDPYFQHLYRVSMDGSGLTLLTPEDANHKSAYHPTSAISSTGTRLPWRRPRQCCVASMVGPS